MSTKKSDGISLLEETINDLDNVKVPLFNSIRKLNRAAKLLDEKKLIIWTEVQLGNSNYIIPLEQWIKCYLQGEKNPTKSNDEKTKKAYEKLSKVGIELHKDFSTDELSAKANESGGGFKNIGFIEEKYNDLVKRKIGNDNTFYKSNLTTTLSLIKSIAYKKASHYHSKYSYENLPESIFDLLKHNVDDVLFDLDPELAEMLMLIFKSLTSSDNEEWSQALTSCRRFLEKLADLLYPASENKANGRTLNQNNYINRLWAFMDENISSKSNKGIAKRNVDFLGNYLQSLYKITNKGVHSTISRQEAIKSVFHIYLMCADILDYLPSKKANGKLNIHTASLDEIEAFGCVSRKIAKEIIKARVNNSVLTKKIILSISGLGQKTFEKLIENISLEPL